MSNGLVFSPSDEWLATISTQTTTIFNTVTGLAIPSASGFGTVMSRPAWHPSSLYLAVNVVREKTDSSILLVHTDPTLAVVVIAHMIKHAAKDAALAWSSDGELLACRTRDGNVSIWSDRTCLRTISAAAPSISSHPLLLVWLRGRHIFGTVDFSAGQLKYWDADTGLPTGAQNLGKGATVLQLSPDGRWLVVGYNSLNDGLVFLRVDGAMESHRFMTGVASHDLYWLADGRRVAITDGFAARTIRIFDVPEAVSRRLPPISGESSVTVAESTPPAIRVPCAELACTQPIQHFACLSASSSILTFDKDEYFCLWDTNTHKARYHFRSFSTINFGRFEMSPNDEWIATESGSNNVNILKSQNGTVHKSFHLAGETIVARPAWSPNSQRLAVGTTVHGTIGVAILALNDDPCVTKVALGPQTPVLEQTLAWSSDGELLACRMNNGTVKIVSGGGIRHDIHVAANGAPMILFWLQGGHSFVTNDIGAGTIDLWDADTGTALAAWAFSSDGVISTRLSPNGRWLACGKTCGELEFIKVCERTRHILRYPYAAHGVCWLPDGRRIATCELDSKTVRIYDVPEEVAAGPTAPEGAAGHLPRPDNDDASASATGAATPIDAEELRGVAEMFEQLEKTDVDRVVQQVAETTAAEGRILRMVRDAEEKTRTNAALLEMFRVTADNVMGPPAQLRTFSDADFETGRAAHRAHTLAMYGWSTGATAPSAAAAEARAQTLEKDATALRARFDVGAALGPPTDALARAEATIDQWRRVRARIDGRVAFVDLQMQAEKRARGRLNEAAAVLGEAVTKLVQQESEVDAVEHTNRLLGMFTTKGAADPEHCGDMVPADASAALAKMWAADDVWTAEAQRRTRARRKRDAGDAFEGTQCCLCLERPRAVSVKPCRHLVYCIECFETMLREKKIPRKCPLCTRAVVKTVKHYL